MNKISKHIRTGIKDIVAETVVVFSVVVLAANNLVTETILDMSRPFVQYKMSRIRETSVDLH